MNANNTSISRVAGSASLDDILSQKGLTASDIIDQVSYNDKIKYHEFDDTARYSHEYREDDGEDEADWFREHSNFDDLISDMDWTDRDYFRDWTRGHFMHGQQYEGFSRMSQYDQDRTRTYDEFLDQAVTDEGITLSRRATAELLGLDRDALPTANQLKRMKGKIVVSQGSMSTGAAKDGLIIGSDEVEKPIEYKIHIAPGAKGAGMWLGDHRINGWDAKQREFMTNRDAVFVIGDSKKKKTVEDYSWWSGRTESVDIHEVHLYYIGRLPHDYGKGYAFK